MGKITKTNNDTATRLQGILLEAANVRRDDDEPWVWRPVGLPVKLRSDGMRPALQLELPGAILSGAPAKATFWSNGSALGVSISTSTNSQATTSGGVSADAEVVGTAQLSCEVSRLALLSAEPIFGEVVEPGVVRLMLRYQRAVYLTYDASGTMTYHGEMPAVAHCALHVADETSLSVTIPTITLSGESVGLRSGRLSAADTAIVTKAVLAAYAQLQTMAAERGYLLQPVLGRCRVIDGAGDTVALSPIVELAAGFQCCSDLTMTTSDNMLTLSGGVLAAKGYHVALMAPESLASPWRKMLKSVAVELTPQIDPVDTSGQCTASASNNGSVTTVTVRLPGVGETDAIGLLKQQAQVVDTLTNCSGNFYEHARYAHPYADSFCDQTVAPSLHATKVADSGLEAERDATDYGAACGCSGAVVLANPHRAGFNGYSLRDLAVASNRSAVKWEGAVVVKLRNGELAVNYCNGRSGCPTQLSPLLIYPDVEASEMTVVITTGGVTHSETFVLTPLPALGIAYYLAADNGKITPANTVSGVSLPDSTVAERYDVGVVSVCEPHRYRTPIDTQQCANGEIYTILEAPRGTGNWDYAREKLILYGLSGIIALTLNASKEIRSATLLDNREIRSAQSVQVTGGSKGVTHMAIAGGDLVEVERNSVTTLRHNCPALTACRCALRNEIWLIFPTTLCRLTADDELIAVEFDAATADADGANATTTTTIDATTTAISGLAAPVTLTTFGGRLLIACADALYDAGMERTTDTVAWRVRERFERPAVNARKSSGSVAKNGAGSLAQTDKGSSRWCGLPTVTVEFGVLASDASGSVTLGGDNGSRVAEPLLTVELLGQVNSPVRVPFVAPLRRFLESSVTLTTPLDAEWRGVSVINY
jgi:hypothetical protein